jgi:hypothetical protein
VTAPGSRSATPTKAELIESLIVTLKREKPCSGARKIRELLVRRPDHDVHIPAKSTTHAVMHRHGLVKIPGRPRHRAEGTPLSQGIGPNALFNLSILSVW